jgi:hypothetical protein
MSNRSKIEPLIQRIAQARARRREVLRQRGDTAAIDAEGRAAVLELGRAIYAMNPQVILWLDEMDRREEVRDAPQVVSDVSYEPPPVTDITVFAGLATAVAQIGHRLSLIARLMRGTCVPQLQQAQIRQALELAKASVAECRRIEEAYANQVSTDRTAAHGATPVLPINRFDELLSRAAGATAPHPDGERQPA